MSKYKGIATPEAILCFPSLFTPKKFEGSEKEKYEAILVFPKGTDISGLETLAKEAFREKFPKGATGARSPFRNGDEVADAWGEHFRGATFIRVSSQIKPAIVDAGKRPITEEDRVYSGCIVRAAIHAYAYDNKGNRGVSFGLDALQVVRDGERLGGGSAGVGLFDDLSGESSPDALFD